MKYLASIYLTEDSSKMYSIPSVIYRRLNKFILAVLQYLSTAKDYKNALNSSKPNLSVDRTALLWTQSCRESLVSVSSLENCIHGGLALCVCKVGSYLGPRALRVPWTQRPVVQLLDQQWHTELWWITPSFCGRKVFCPCEEWPSIFLCRTILYVTMVSGINQMPFVQWWVSLDH